MSEADRTIPRHPIRVVAQRTGLKPDLIRAWERRYSAIEPRRTAGRHRLYSDRDVERLRLLREATRAWRNIGQVAQLDDDSLRRLVATDRQRASSPETGPRGAALPATAAQSSAQAEKPAEEAPTLDDPVAAALEAIERLDGPALADVLERAHAELDAEKLITRVLSPLLHEIGERWRRGVLRPMHEHLASSVIRTFTSQLSWERPPAPDAPHLVVTTPAGQRHENGALFAAVVAAAEGWRVTYLGADLPAGEISAAAQGLGARGVALSLVYPTDDPKVGEELRELRRRLGPEVPLLVGGQAASAYAEELQAAGATLVADLGHLDKTLEQLHDSAGGEGQGPAKAHKPRTAWGRRQSHRSAKVTEPTLELAVSRRALERFELDRELISPEGRLRLPDLRAVRRAALKINAGRHLQRRPERTLRAGELNAACLVQTVLRNLLGRYRSERRPAVLHDALEHLCRRFDRARVEAALRAFATDFPVPECAREALALDRSGNGALPAQAELIFEEMLLVWLANRNPAFASLQDLFDDSELDAETDYRKLLAELETSWQQGGSELFDLLETPARGAPGSLRSQLELLLRLKEELFGQVVERLLVGLDVIAEEERPVFPVDGPPPPEAEVMSFERLGAAEPRRPEREWMPRVVAMAKVLPVWLEQISRRAGREISRLDQIPDAELERLAAWGVNALWLVGLWQRSPASAKIQELCGRQGAGASAYAIVGYRVATEFGGEAAFQDLEERSHRFGLQLVGDLVPNHTAIDGDWVIDGPERFLSVEESPFPGHTFGGPDLSSNPRVEIFLEDHYFDRTDAAVVFKRLDKESGEARYLYHGNDGTGLPWNDTAQLDFLDAETRAAVISQIVEAARRFPILRLDAAMALVREHVKRLWYPDPGGGGAIPSRAEHGLAVGEFERRMPREFWQEVVEKIHAEAPATLLLAEGFWMMEATMIHLLGIDRVYNSAFLHMLRDEDNAGYRATLKNTLGFDPTILGRFANFLTTPDEPAAAEALGRGDKYFAMATLLATLPGLVILGHGQFEGMSEHYGMHATRPRLDEKADRALLTRHQREIAPLLARRELFSGTDNFRLLDFELDDGRVVEDVFTFTNAHEDERVLVVVHNRDARVAGRLKRSVPYRPMKRSGEPGSSRRVSLREALCVGAKSEEPCRYKDLITGREHEISAQELTRKGLHLELGPYEVRVFGEFQAIS